MEIEIRSQNVQPSVALNRYIERRITNSLRRFSRRVRRVTIRIHDLNGPRGGIDKVYRFNVELLPSGAVQLQEIHSDFYTAIDRAIARLRRSVGRSVKRRYRSQRGRESIRRSVSLMEMEVSAGAG